MLKDIDLKYKSGILTTTKNLTLSGSGANLSIGGNATVTGVLALNSGATVNFGANGDTNLYRSGADALATDDGFAVGMDLTVFGKAVVTGSLSIAGVDISAVQPGDLGLKAWTYDPAAVSASQAITSGTIYLNGIYIRKAMSISALCYIQAVAGTLPTAGANWIGLYNASGSKLIDAALDSVMTSTGVKSVTVTTQSLTPGLYWVALLQNATAQTGGASNSVGTVQNFTALGLTSGATARYATNGTGASTLPSSITPASNSQTGAKFFWTGLN